MTTFIHRTSSSNEHYNGDGDYALITITPEDAKRYLKLIEHHGVLKDEEGCGALYRMVFWCADIYFVPYGDGKEWMEGADDQPLELDDGDPRIAALKETAIRTECDQLSVTDGSVYWTAYVKHSGVLLSTGGVYRQQLEEIANKGAPPC